MAKGFWETYLAVAAVLLVLGMLWIFATIAYGVQQWSSWSLGPVYATAGVVATSFGAYAMLKAKKLYDESRRDGGFSPTRPLNAK